MDQLEEGVAILRGLLHDEETTFEGTWFTVRNARNEPRPVQDKLPIWIGGGGEKRTLRIAARYADGWNVPFVDPQTFAAKRDVLHRHCADVGRDPAEIRCAVNVGLAWTEESLHQQFGLLAPRVRPGVLGGSVQEVVDRVGEYVAAGADQVNLALRAPFDVDALEQFSAAMALSRLRRSSAPGVRVPHQKRSWPSTRSTIASGNARRSSSTWASVNVYGSLGTSTRSGASTAAELDGRVAVGHRRRDELDAERGRAPTRRTCRR